MIMASIAKLGFNIKDVKVLLNSGPQPRPHRRVVTPNVRNMRVTANVA
jgi:hypothetical protein